MHTARNNARCCLCTQPETMLGVVYALSHKLYNIYVCMFKYESNMELCAGLASDTTHVGQMECITRT